MTAAASRRRIALTTVVLVALSGGALLRLAGIGFGLPDRFRPDEQYLVERAWGLGGEAGWNPRFAGYPAGQIYAIFGAAHAARAVGHGDWDPAREDGRSTWYLTGRLCTAALGIATIALAAWLAAAMAADAAGRAGAAAAWAASLAALLTAGAFLHVRDSHFATTDVPVGFWSVAALLSLARVLERARWRDSIASGALVGLATATKYPAATLLVPVAVAHFASARGGAHAGSARGCFRGRALRLAGALAASAIAFAATTPYVLLDRATTRANLGGKLKQLAEPGFLAPGGFAWLLRFALPAAVGWPLTLAAISGTVWCLARGRTLARLVALWILVACAPLLTAQLVFLRYLVPLVPAMMALVATAAVGVAGERRGVRYAAAALLLAALAPSLARSIAFDRLIRETDTRSIARAWMEQHLPPATVVHVPHHGETNPFEVPQIDPARVAYARATDDLPAGAYVLVASHPVPHARRPSPRLQARLRTAELLLEVQPFRPGAPRPGDLVYEPVDAFFVPLFGFERVERPGPRLQLFRLTAGP
ncbi:MAG TPA: glycosyltransferase family 39 protein [Candidatus Binatia bacterium]|nr:glycosyltransferase family 39 protein [Candidatus Binatia bacterium]